MSDAISNAISNFWRTYGSAAVTILGVSLALYLNVHDSKNAIAQQQEVTSSLVASTERLADKVSAIAAALSLETQRAQREDQLHATAASDLAERVRQLELRLAAAIKP